MVVEAATGFGLSSRASAGALAVRYTSSLGLTEIVMDPTDLIDRLTVQLDAVVALTTGVTAKRARRRPAPDRWSMIEVLAHLLDEERDDFRRRLHLVLESPDTEWPAIDPEAWARDPDRDYRGRDLADTVAELRRERAESVRGLRALVDPDWTHTYSHPVLGDIRAGDLLASWCLHDVLHLRQLINLVIDDTKAEVIPFSTSYAAP